MTDKVTYEIRPEGQSLLRGVFSDPERAATAARDAANETGYAQVITEVTVTTTKRPFGRFEPA